MPALKRTRSRSRGDFPLKRRRTTTSIPRLLSNANAAKLSRQMHTAAAAKSRSVTLRYSESVVFNAPTGGKSSQVYVANGVFDPNFTGIGHQPMGFDQWTALYERWTVTASRIHVAYQPSSVSNLTPGEYTINLSSDSTPPVDGTSAIELQFGNKSVIWGSTTSEQNGRPLIQSFDAKRFFDKGAIVGESQYSGTTGANASSSAYFIVQQHSIQGNDPVGSNARVLIEYDVTFYDPIRLTAS